MKFRVSMMTVILVASLIATGCPKKTTLDKVGGLTIAGVDSYLLQLDGLRDEGVLSGAKHTELIEQARAIRKRAVDFRDKIASYAEIRPGDVKAIVTIAGDLIGLLDASLNDGSIIRLPPDALALQILRGLRIGVSQAKITLAALFPEPGNASVASRSIPLESRGVKPSRIIVNLQ